MAMTTGRYAARPLGPGGGGYVIAVAVSLVVFSTLVTASLANSDGLAWGGTFLFVLIVGVIPATAIGFLGVGVLELVTGRFRHQWPAVVLACVVGAAEGAALLPHSLVFATYLGVSAGVGRLSVVPLVARRRIALRDRRTDVFHHRRGLGPTRRSQFTDATSVFRLRVDGVFEARRRGTVVVGEIVTGEISVGDFVAVENRDIAPTKVVGIDPAPRIPDAAGQSFQRVGLLVPGWSKTDVTLGDILVHATNQPH
ncbi:hypothetical protein [Nocardioides baekrokdamisoli]|uniref:hypothetical protein n=1 Tax=Nocardioides baekrokdamisoli TaxID=1804624 RepID=UPI000F7B5C89|nr:hypothetical protein [Nocardioides baekrokdamisoli]